VFEKEYLSEVIHLDGTLELLEGHIGQTREYGQAGRVDSNIDPTIQLQRGIGEGGHLSFIAGITPHRFPGDTLCQTL
jgi:hypothetical protein